MKRLLGALGVGLIGCAPAPPRNVADTLPKLIGDAVPFRYPSPLYEQRIEGDVMLRLHIDTSGVVVPESVRVEQTSRIPLFDSAAVEGAPLLLFRPALLGGRRVPITVLFPVQFRMPSASPTPADSGEQPGR
ncbi:MAG TPA: energy transducer TonB [Gemmatimonadaceae bacterium]|nr:energy transducer TonB [Gemmatimonadaceae bacterium]